MELWADTHVHIYPEHQPERLLDAVWRHLGHPEREVGIFLVEVSSLHWFRHVREDPASLSPPYQVETTSDPCVLRMVKSPEGSANEQTLWCFSGRQIVTAERLEILGLVMEDDVPDGLPAAEAIRQVHNLGGIPVLAWGLGKWLFKRGAVVRNLLAQFDPDELWIGDNGIRPWGWPSPILRDPHRRILAGGDPLPMAGEEDQAGTYGVRFPRTIDPLKPAESVRALLKSAPGEIQRMGRRNHPLMTIRRMWNYQRRSSLRKNTI